MASRILPLIFLLNANLCFALYDFDIRYQVNRSMNNLLQQTVIWRDDWKWAKLDVGGRVSESWISIERLQYMGELRVEPSSFFHVLARLEQTVNIGQSGATTGTAVGGLCLPAEPVEFCVEFGIMRRWWQLSSTAWLPFVYGTSIAEWDFPARIRIGLRWAELWKTTLEVSSFERMDVYNIHNPFAQLTVWRLNAWENMDFVGYGRYQIFLGFGTFKSIMVGAGVRFYGDLF